MLENRGVYLAWLLTYALGRREVEGGWEMVGGSGLFFCGDFVFECEGPCGSVPGFAVGRDPPQC